MTFEGVEAEGGPFGPDRRDPEVRVDGEGGDEGERGGSDACRDQDVAKGDALGCEEEEGVCCE